MTDALQIARQRRKDHEAAIAEKEREIEELREMIGELDSFIEFGEALVGDEKPQIKEVPQPFAAAPAPTTVADDEDPADDWNVPDEDNGAIARMLASRG